MRTLIVVPTMGNVKTIFFDSCMRLLRSPEDGLITTESSLIYDARNQLARKAIEAGAEYMLWLDSDMGFQPDTLNRLMEDIQGKDFVSGLYFRRRPCYEPCIFQNVGYVPTETEEVIPVAETYLDYPKEGLFEVAACGFGCVLMRTEMYQKVWEQKGLPFSPILGFGEDLSFCLRATECGYKLYCDPTIKCDHLATITVNENMFEVWRNVKQSENGTPNSNN